MGFSDTHLVFQLMALVDWERVRECPGCGEAFRIHDKRQQYCTAKCRCAHNQRAYYARLTAS